MKERFFISLLLLAASCAAASGQEGNFLRYKVERGDTVYVGNIAPAVKYAAGSGRYWRKQSRLLYNFSKTYPYALEAKRLIKEVDKDIDGENMKRRKKERYINAIQKELMDRYEPVLRKMTVSQGKLLIKLIGRETGLTPYEIIHDYKNGAAANTWQAIARLFGGDLKKRYDPSGEDKDTEYLVKKWEDGQYPALYMSVFGKPPQIPVIDPDYGDAKRRTESRRQKQRNVKTPSNP